MLRSIDKSNAGQAEASKLLSKEIDKNIVEVALPGLCDPGLHRIPLERALEHATNTNQGTFYVGVVPLKSLHHT